MVVHSGFYVCGSCCSKIKLYTWHGMLVVSDEFCTCNKIYSETGIGLLSKSGKT